MAESELEAWCLRAQARAVITAVGPSDPNPSRHPLQPGARSQKYEGWAALGRGPGCTRRAGEDPQAFSEKSGLLWGKLGKGSANRSRPRAGWRLGRHRPTDGRRATEDAGLRSPLQGVGRALLRCGIWVPRVLELPLSTASTSCHLPSVLHAPAGCEDT